METSPGVSNSTLTTVTKIEAPTWRLDPTRFSSWLRLKRVRAWVIRFINNCRLKRQQKYKRTKGELASEEVNDSENQLVRFAQRNAFVEEIVAVRNRKELPEKSKLLPLSPWLDEDELLRIGGRLQFVFKMSTFFYSPPSSVTSKGMGYETDCESVS